MDQQQQQQQEQPEVEQHWPENWEKIAVRCERCYKVGQQIASEVNKRQLKDPEKAATMTQKEKAILAVAMDTKQPGVGEYVVAPAAAL